MFALKDFGNIYTRLNNPTTEVFEKRVASLENGAGALATSSGMSAISYSIMNVAESGDNIIASSKLYGGSITLLTHTLKRFGIETKFFDIENPDEVETLIDEKTKAIFFESLSNPTVHLADIERLAKIGNLHSIITIVDNTVPSPILINPIDFGIDVVVHSASKYIGGQGLAIGGVIVERENLVEKIRDNKLYPQFNLPDESYHGFIYVDAPLPIFTLRARLLFLRDFGGVIAPFNSWLLIQGVETLSVRMKEVSQTALKVAQFLENHQKVKSVNYPKLNSYKYRDLANRYLKNGGSGLMSFEVESYEEATKIVNSVEIFSLVTNIGDSKSIITHPASTTHQQLSEEELESGGVSKGLIRLSIGLENSDDLIADLERGLSNI